MADRPNAVRWPRVEASDSPERVIAAAWAEVLGVPEVEVDVGFFDLGADSMMVMHVVGLLRGTWPELKVLDVFANPTVASLASFLTSDA